MPTPRPPDPGHLPLPWAPRSAWLWALALVSALALACSEPDEPVASAPTPAATPVPEGIRLPPHWDALEEAERRSHAEMLFRLESVRRAAGDNPYTGSGRLRLRQEALRALPPDAPATERVVALQRVARQQLRLGQNEPALATLEQARALLDTAASHPDRARIDRALLFQEAVSWMRLGETANCAADHNPERCLLPIRGRGRHSLPRGSTEAVARLQELLAAPGITPDETLEARWLLALAAMTLGRYPEAMPDAARFPDGLFESDVTFPRLRDIAGSVGLDRFDMAGGMLVEDLNGDGLLDVFTTSWDSTLRPAYYERQADGSFRERGLEAGLDGILGGLNALQADYDNDGDQDILILRGAWLLELGHQPNSLLQNDGEGRFVDVSHMAGLLDRDLPTQTAVWADFDRDGWLDLYIGNEGRGVHSGPNQLYRNRGDGTFEDIAEQAGVRDGRHTKGVAAGDLDGDGWPDLYVSNLNGPNRLYRNLGDGRFVDVAPALGVDGPESGFPTAILDFDNDGHLDILALNYWAQPRHALARVVAGRLGEEETAPLPALYRNLGNGTFQDIATSVGLDRHLLPMGMNFGDLDGDGWLDLYLGTGYPRYEGLMPNLLLRNVAGERLEDISAAAGLGHLQKGHGIAFADLDQDGDLDLLAQLGGAYPGDAFSNTLFENPGNQTDFVVLELRGTDSPPSAVGATLMLEIPGPQGPRQIHRQVNSGGSFGASPLRQHIGIGTTGAPTRLEVRWPRSGAVEVFTGLQAGGRYRITEGTGRAEPLPHSTLPFRAPPHGTPPPSSHHH